MRIPIKVRTAVYERDGGYCPHCGESAAIGLQHRANRGMGGSRLLDTPVNLLTFCNVGNSGMESDAQEAATARRFGWKISRYDDPANIPVYDAVTGRWWLLDNDYGRSETPKKF